MFTGIVEELGRVVRLETVEDSARLTVEAPTVTQDASLGEIHQTFLATHKNVRVTADDAGIARVEQVEARLVLRHGGDEG